MQYNEKIINYYYSFFNEIDYLLKYNINIFQTKILNYNMNQNMINVIKKSIIETLETPYYYNLFKIKNYNNLLKIINATYINSCDYKKYFNNHILFKYYIHNNNNNLYYILKILYEYKFYNLNIINISSNLENLYNVIGNTILSHVNILQKYDILPFQILENINAITNLNTMNDNIYLHLVSSLYYYRYIIYDDISIFKNINIDNNYYQLNNNNLFIYDNNNTIDTIIKEIIYYQYPLTKNNLINNQNYSKKKSINLLSTNLLSTNLLSTNLLPTNLLPTNLLPNITQSNITQSNITQSNITTQSNIIQSNKTQSNKIQSNKIQSNNISYKILPPNILQPNIIQPNIIQPKIIQPKIIQPKIQYPKKNIESYIYITHIPISNKYYRPTVKLNDKDYYYIRINNKYYYSPVNNL